MIDVRSNLGLKEKLYHSDDFAVGVELVSTRGTMTETKTMKARAFSEDLTVSKRVDWVSITDNAGGNPQLSPLALGTPILYGGKEVVVHMTCKDLNRHGLESQLWLLSSHGFNNILALTGDYPLECYRGKPKAVFDIDSVGLLKMIEDLNGGLEVTVSKKQKRLGATNFFTAAVTSNFKYSENTVMPQYLKLEKKIECGAQYIINQIGYDSRKLHELLVYMQARSLGHIPVIGNVYLLTAPVARVFNQKRIPGVVVSDELLEVCTQQKSSPDKGRQFFKELAAKQIAIYRGLGYKGAYLGGIHSYKVIEDVLDIEKSYAPDDWKEFAKELQYARDGEFFLYEQDPETLLTDPERINASYLASLKGSRKTKNVTFSYGLSKSMHSLAFDRGKKLAKVGEKLCEKSKNKVQGPKLIRITELLMKSVLFSCQDCGDCSLSETSFLCPESQCAKNQRNGPCGGARDGMCEVHDYECIWARAYDRMKHDGKEKSLLDHAPVFQNQALRGTSAWVNCWQGKDHIGLAKSEKEAKPES